MSVLSREDAKQITLPSIIVPLSFKAQDAQLKEMLKISITMNKFFTFRLRTLFANLRPKSTHKKKKPARWKTKINRSYLFIIYQNRPLPVKNYISLKWDVIGHTYQFGAGWFEFRSY